MKKNLIRAAYIVGGILLIIWLFQLLKFTIVLTVAILIVSLIAYIIEKIMQRSGK